MRKEEIMEDTALSKASPKTAVQKWVMNLSYAELAAYMKKHEPFVSRRGSNALKTRSPREHARYVAAARTYLVYKIVNQIPFTVVEGEMFFLTIYKLVDELGQYALYESEKGTLVMMPTAMYYGMLEYADAMATQLDDTDREAFATVRAYFDRQTVWDYNPALRVNTLQERVAI